MNIINNHLRKTRLFFLIIVMAAASLIPLTVFAIDVDFYSANDILFYNPDSCSTSGSSGSTSTADGSAMPYELPATSGKAGFEEAIDSSGRIPNGDAVSFPKHAALGEEYQQYYITMRWNYVSWDWNGRSHDVDSEQLNWFSEAPRIVLVTNERTGKSINAVALEAGPGPWTGVDHSSNNNPKQGWVNPQRGTPSAYTGRVAGFPPTAVKALDMKMGMYDGTGDVLTYEWAKDQTVKPGPTGDSATGGSSDCSGSNAGEYGWDLEGENAMVFYDQSDSEWKDKPFGTLGTIGACGCGPTSLAMIVATLTGDKSVNPENMAAFYASKGGQSSGCGSNHIWDVIEPVYGVNVTDLGGDMTKAKEVLRRGGLVLVSWSNAPFTGGGHIIVLRKYDPNGKVYVASSGGTTNRKQSDMAWDEKIFTEGYSGPEVPGRGSTGNQKGLWGIEKK